MAENLTFNISNMCSLLQRQEIQFLLNKYVNKILIHAFSMYLRKDLINLACVQFFFFFKVLHPEC